MAEEGFVVTHVEKHLREGFRLGSEMGATLRHRLAAQEAEVRMIEREAQALHHKIRVLAERVGALEPSTIRAEDDEWHH